MVRKAGKGGGKAAKAKAKTNAAKQKARKAAPTRPKQKREQFKENKEGHVEEADRLIKIARAAPYNKTTQPEICALITDKTIKLDQDPLFIGEGPKRETLSNYIRKVLRETGGTVLPRSGAAAWHIGKHGGHV